MNLKNFINQFYFDMTIHELQRMNESTNLPNITYNSILYLDMIAYVENCTVSFIANAMNVAKSAVTIKVNELMNLGLVDKVQSEEDKRINYLKVRPSVVEEYKAYDQTLYDALQKIEEQYSEKEIVTFCEMLKTISDSYGKGVQNE